MIVVKNWIWNNKFENRRDMVESFIRRYGSNWIERDIRLVGKGLVRECYVEIVGSWDKRRLKVLSVDIGDMKLIEYLNSSWIFKRD